MSFRKLTKVWNKTHFDKDNKPKTLQVSYNQPEPGDYNNVKEGNVILTIFSKENTQGFQLSTGDCGDFIDILSSIRKSLISKSIKMQQEVE